MRIGKRCRGYGRYDWPTGCGRSALLRGKDRILPRWQARRTPYDRALPEVERPGDARGGCRRKSPRCPSRLSVPCATTLGRVGAIEPWPRRPEGIEGGHHHQTALMALGTTLDVDTREALHHGRGGVTGPRGERGLRKQAATCRDPGRTTAIA